MARVTDPFPIKLSLDITAGKDVAFTEKTEFTSDSLCNSKVVVPAGQYDVATTVAIAAEIDVNYFKYLVIRPTLIGVVPITPARLRLPVEHPSPCAAPYDVLPTPPQPVIEYSVVHCPTEQRKPLFGTHVFANGQTEWVTDMQSRGGPGAVTKLWFWNKLPKASFGEIQDEVVKKKITTGPDGKLLVGEAYDHAIKCWEENANNITIHIVAGYDPVVKPAPPAAN